MKIVTKTGDTGQTGLVGGQRVAKSSLRVECYGNVDELNSALGVAASWDTRGTIHSEIEHLQTILFLLAADLATPPQTGSTPCSQRISAEHVKKLEQLIDLHETEIPEQKGFIIPGGCQVASALHLGRTIARRAERSAWRLAQEESVSETALVFLNRLSDYLFTLARVANMKYNVADQTLSTDSR